MTSAHGNGFHNADHVESGQFAFESTEAGDYMACFFAPDHQPPITLTVDFDWKTGVAAKDWSNVAKKGQVDVSFFFRYYSVYYFRHFISAIIYLFNVIVIDSFFL